MTKITIKEIEKHFNQNLVRSNIVFKYAGDDNAQFTIVSGPKNISGTINIDADKILLNDISTNYSYKYIGTFLKKVIRDTNLDFDYTLQSFSTGDIIYLNKEQTNLNQISNFFYYGFNDTIDCRERICSQALSVTYLGIEQILCGGEMSRKLSKYRVIN